jgi:hypothetical protein
MRTMKRNRIIQAMITGLALLALTATPMRADHILSATLSWQNLGGGIVRFVPIVYFRTSELQKDGQLGATPVVGDIICEPAGAAGLRINFGDNTNTPDLCFRILSINGPDDWVKTVAVQPSGNPATAANTITHTYASTATTYEAEMFGCCRISEDMNNRIAKSFRLATKVEFTTNNPPTATTGDLLVSDPPVATMPSLGTDGFFPILIVPQTLVSGGSVQWQMHATDLITPVGNLYWTLATNDQATNPATNPTTAPAVPNTLYYNTPNPPGSSTNGNPDYNGPSSESGKPAFSISPSGLVTWYNFGVDNALPWTVQFYVYDGNPNDASSLRTPIDLLLIMVPQPPQQTGDGCTGTQGYWKNHPDAWPVSSIVVGGVNYSKNAAIALWKVSGGSDMTYKMFDQLGAAMLNVQNGADASCIALTIANANAFLAAHPVGSGVKASSTAWQTEGALLHSTLTDYNEGKLCAPHRDSGACQQSDDSSGGGNGKGKGKIK